MSRGDEIAGVPLEGSSRQRERTRGQAPVTTGGLPGARKGTPESRLDNILWNIPEQKSGKVSVVGGNSQNFSGVIKASESLVKLPIQTVRTVLPDALQKQLPPLPDLVFTKSTNSGSFDKSPELNAAFADADITLLAGDLSKNSATAAAIAEAIRQSDRPVVLAKDATDLLAPEMQRLLTRPGITIIATLAQLQKLFRAMYYPKVLMLSMPMQPVKEALHKFTLSYPATILTLHEGQIIVAHGGELATTPLEKTAYSAISLWTGDLPAKVAALQLWNPSQPFAAAHAALTWQP